MPAQASQDQEKNCPRDIGVHLCYRCVDSEATLTKVVNGNVDWLDIVGFWSELPKEDAGK
jgi:hypothetical protein